MVLLLHISSKIITQSSTDDRDEWPHIKTVFVQKLSFYAGEWRII